MTTVNFALLVSAMVVVRLSAQIDQTHPELCGRPGGIVPIPSNVSASVDRQDGHADVFIKINDSVSKIGIPGAVDDDVKEVCPLKDGRLVVFGDAMASDNISIIDGTRGQLLDSFYGGQPAMSPDQRWLIYRKFYPRHTELPASEEYLLYDLEKSPAGNRAVNTPPEEREDVGRVVFPLVGNSSAPFNNIGLPESQQHSIRSDRFFWASDSHAVIFGDSVQVLITIDGSGATKAYVSPASVSDVCSAKPAGVNAWWTISDAEIGVGGGGDRQVDIRFRTSDCGPKQLTLRMADFRSAALEIHVEPKRKGAVVVQE